jgi:hypothetical protein
VRGPDDALIWTCSACAKASPWTDDHGYLGTIECSGCWTAEIDYVWCSDACRFALIAAGALPENMVPLESKSGGVRQKKVPRGGKPKAVS